MALARAAAVRRVWGSVGPDGIGLLRRTIVELRRKLELDPANPRSILTANTIGYQLRARRAQLLPLGQPMASAAKVTRGGRSKRGAI